LNVIIPNISIILLNYVWVALKTKSMISISRHVQTVLMINLSLMVKNVFIAHYLHFGMTLLRIVQIVQEVGSIFNKLHNAFAQNLILSLMDLIVYNVTTQNTLIMKN
jgi:hypothetical protein